MQEISKDAALIINEFALLATETREKSFTSNLRMADDNVNPLATENSNLSMTALDITCRKIVEVIISI